MLKLAFSNIRRRKIRTALSVFMIAVGVASIIALTSLADGVFLDIQSAFSQMQGIMVYERSPYGPMFTQTDISVVDRIRAVPGIKSINPAIMQPAKTIEGKPLGFDMDSIVRLIGTEHTGGATTAGIQGEIVKGRNLRAGERGNVVIGEGVEEKYTKFVGNRIRIDGESYQIVGVYSTGSTFLNMGVLMELNDLRELVGFSDNKVTMINIELHNPGEIDRISKLVKFRLGDNYSVINTTQFAESLAGIMGNLRLFVIAVASIAALIAAVGILNTMLMSVMERFKEIGALKATGWTNFNVMQMILYESFLIGIFGGILGMFLGTTLSIFAGQLIDISVYVSPQLLLESFAFALFIGVFSGIYPAWKAGRFDPIDALREE